MMLNKKEIEQQNLIISGFNRGSLRNAGYDLCVTKLIRKVKNHQGEVVEESTDEAGVEPQGVVVAISEEVLKLPLDVCAYASVKTSLCRKGILAINTGVVDPGWEGPLSSLLLNFGKESYGLRKGDAFLRLTFHRLSEYEGKYDHHPRREYEADTKSKFVSRLGESFMNLEAAADKAAGKMHGEMRAMMFRYLPLAAAMLAALTFLVNFGTLKLANWTTPSEMVLTRAKALTDQVERQEDKLEDQNSQLKQQLQQLQNELDQIKNRK